MDRSRNGLLHTIRIEQDKSEEAMYHYALKVLKDLGKSHLLTLIVAHNLATNFDSQGKTDEAEKMIRRVWQGFEKELGPEHTMTLYSACDLGDICIDRDGQVETEEICQSAL
jgi:hypothetical protein